MKVVLKTDEYTIFQRRDERHAIKDVNRAWVNGDAKIAILLEHKLIQAAPAKRPEREPEVEATAATVDVVEAEAGEKAVGEAENDAQ